MTMNPLRWSFRTGFALAAAICAAFIAYALYAQYQLHLEPCPLCIFQRMAVIGLFIVFAVAALHAPRGARGKRVYGILGFIVAAIGISVAGRHVWLQHLPADQVPACGPGLDYMLDSFPLAKTLKMVFTGSGECAKVDWTFIGLSMPEWTLIWFVIFAIGSLYFGFRRYQS
jgi:disulfide bond formation protein DsbB